MPIFPNTYFTDKNIGKKILMRLKKHCSSLIHIIKANNMPNKNPPPKKWREAIPKTDLSKIFNPKERQPQC